MTGFCRSFRATYRKNSECGYTGIQSTQKMSSPATGTAPTPAPGSAGIGVDAEHEARTRMRFKHWASTFASRHSLPRRRQPRHHSAARSGSGSAAGQRPPRAPRWWKIRLFRGMVNDVRRRAPYYWSDWSDAWDYRVVPATVYMYFAKYVALVVGRRLTFSSPFPLFVSQANSVF